MIARSDRDQRVVVERLLVGIPADRGIQRVAFALMAAVNLDAPAVEHDIESGSSAGRAPC